MKTIVKDGKLIIEIDMEQPHPSQSGKTLVVASSYGIQKTEASVNGKQINVGLNAFIHR